jgi:general L-amino acid transport system permease protein
MGRGEPRRPPRWASPRALLLQGALLALVVALVWFLARNAGANLAQRNITFGFAFLGQTAGFDIPFRIVPWSVTDTYGRALLVCLVNTLLVSALGIVAASLLGLLLGIMRLSANWLVRTTALALVELVRNTPQLLQIVFWYVGVLQALPQARQSLLLPGGAFLNIRGLYLPAPEFGPEAGAAALALALALAAAPVLWFLKPAGRRIGPWALVPPLAAGLWLSTTVRGLDPPVLQGFNFRGGMVVPPELVALWLGLSIYAAAFIAEIVRGSIEGIDRGQKEAARSLGLGPLPTLLLVVLPQALRIMVPQLTSQYLNLIKSSSLGAAIAYPEIVQIFAGTVLNQSGRALEVMFLVMTIFLLINLATSAFMNWYNRKVALVER